MTAQELRPDSFIDIKCCNAAKHIRELIGDLPPTKSDYDVYSLELYSDLYSFLEYDVLCGKYLDQEIIYCRVALPHIDKFWDRHIFLNFTLGDGVHFFGDLENPEEIEISHGTFFVVDPMIKHWLYPLELRTVPCDEGKPRMFVALSWAINKNNQDDVYRIVESFCKFDKTIGESNA